LWAWVFVDVSWAEAIVVMPNRPRAAADTIAIDAFLIVRFSERRKSPLKGDFQERRLIPNTGKNFRINLPV
jgi:hypothetical protein